MFVRHADFLDRADSRYFEPRPVQLGVEQAETVEVLSGLKENEVIATRGSDAGPLLAGCNRVEPIAPTVSPCQTRRPNRR